MTDHATPSANHGQAERLCKPATQPLRGRQTGAMPVVFSDKPRDIPRDTAAERYPRRRDPQQGEPAARPRSIPSPSL